MDLAEATVAVGDADLARLTNELRADVRRAYFDVLAADARVDIATDLRGLAQRARDAASARVTAGDVPRSDLTQSDLAVAIGESDLLAARGEAQAARTELNALLGRALDSPLTLSDTLDVGPTPTMPAALALATTSSAEVQLLDRRLAEQTARVALAKSQTVPDISAGTAFTYDAEPEFRFGWRASGGVTLPLFTRHRAGVTVEDAALAQLKAEREALISRISGSVAAAVVRANAARDQMTQYQATILPLASESERQAQVAYTGGQIGLPALVQALQTARDTRQRGLQAALDFQHALADLERAIGAPLR